MNDSTNVMEKVAAQTAEGILESTLDTLQEGYKTAPYGVMHAFAAMKGFIAEVVAKLGADPDQSELVKKAVALRTLIGENSMLELDAAKRSDMARVCRESAQIAERVFEGIDMPPFAEANPVVEQSLGWIIPALENAALGENQGDTIQLRYENPCIAPLREAYKLKLVLAGAPDPVSEMRFLVSQELLISRLIKAVPATSLYGYWIALKPVTETGICYHDAVARELEKLEPESWPLDIHASANISFWEAVAETVEANSCDVCMRVLSQQATSFIKDRVESLRTHLAPYSAKWAKSACDRAAKIISGIRVRPAFAHVEFDVWSLSPEATNFEVSATEAATATN